MEVPSTRRLINDALNDLSSDQLASFRTALRERRGDGPRVRRTDVEDKSPLQLSELLVQTFLEDGAVRVTEQLLRDIDCMQTAAELGECAFTHGDFPLAQSPPLADAEYDTKQHFVDRHREELIVSYINPILDYLLQQGVLQGEQYDRIRSLRPTQEQTRTLQSIVGLPSLVLVRV
uniref:LisH domain-containing protein n=1 Tax=Knipowitschia caucasica TaxID=637954 RepID=A0AAV2MFD0_KNICA